MTQYKWYGRQAIAHVEGQVAKRLDRAGRQVRDHIRQQLSRSQPTRGTGINKRGLNPSQPGEYPKKVRGHLRRNVVWEFDRQALKGRVGTNVIYGKYLELGTRKMARRPWLERGMMESVLDIKRILEMGY